MSEYFSAKTTVGLLDADGEQVEAFGEGDYFRIAQHAEGYYPYAVRKVLTVESVEVSTEDHNDFVVLYRLPSLATVQKAHRMDIERLTEESPEMQI